MHQFTVGGLVIGAPEFDEDDVSDRQTFDGTKVFLRDLDFRRLEKPYIIYEYDFGDCWVHQLDFEAYVPLEKSDMKVDLMDGACSGPPEDCGGRDAYGDFVESLRDPTHPEHRSNRHWAGEEFDPDAFDRNETQKVIDQALEECNGSYRFGQ